MQRTNFGNGSLGLITARKFRVSALVVLLLSILVPVWAYPQALREHGYWQKDAAHAPQQSIEPRQTSDAFRKGSLHECCWLFGADLGANDSSSNLFAIDTSGPDSLSLGELGLDDVSDIAFLPDGRLFAVRFTFSGSELLEIDTATVSPITIGPVGFSEVNALVAESSSTFLAATVAGELIRIDSASGIGTFIGFLGSGYGSSGDLAFDSNGDLFGIVHTGSCCNPAILVSINPSTGVANEIGPIGFSNVFGLEFGPTGNLYGVANGDAGETPALITINKGTGSGTLVGALPTGNGMGGLSKSPLVFHDGFESGNVSEWSDSVP